ncbi:hypothetical protein ACRALDRAFT_205316 [Sodiomyces alcalophilus JCM 7366]|uniref:uncharacterized protein n=1 Tax=Sodiomyces alcalophilus JCM 7366 TaxID=591952 RepID=UPI0039B5BEC9
MIVHRVHAFAVVLHSTCLSPKTAKLAIIFSIPVKRDDPGSTEERGWDGPVQPGVIHIPLSLSFY